MSPRKDTFFFASSIAVFGGAGVSGIDAVYAGDIYQNGDSITWDHIIGVKRMAALLSKPLLLPASLNVTEGELKALCEAGVQGIVVEVEAGKPEGIKGLRAIIDKLPLPSARKHGNSEAILPRLNAETKAEPPDEEEDEYEDSTDLKNPVSIP